MKSLPYFRWFPSDASSDEKYKSLNDAELGFFHRCLDHSRVNNGIPADLNELAALFGRTRAKLENVWGKVQRCWYPSEDGTRLLNARQEKERIYALLKSARATESVRTRYERRADEPLRAYGSSSCISILDSSKEETVLPVVSQRFEELWNRWPKQFGKHPACRDWCSVVTIDVEDKVFICLENYLASAEVASGAIMNLGSGLRDIGWIMKCHKDGWDCRWPAAQLPGNRLPQPPKPPIPTAEEQIEALRWIAENDEDPNARESAKEQLAGGKS